MDYIFIIGPGAVGKTTLAKSLYRHYNGVYLEQNMVPEFVVPNGVGDVGIYEEQLCWDNVLLQLKFFYDKGHRNIVALDFDDIRTRELPFVYHLREREGLPIFLQKYSETACNPALFLL